MPRLAVNKPCIKIQQVHRLPLLYLAFFSDSKTRDRFRAREARNPPCRSWSRVKVYVWNSWCSPRSRVRDWSSKILITISTRSPTLRSLGLNQGLFTFTSALKLGISRRYSFSWYSRSMIAGRVGKSKKISRKQSLGIVALASNNAMIRIPFWLTNWMHARVLKYWRGKLAIGGTVGSVLGRGDLPLNQ